MPVTVAVDSERHLGARHRAGDLEGEDRRHPGRDRLIPGPSPATMSAKAAWWLERIAADGSALAVPVQALPFGIGRDEENGLVLVASGVSRRHATLELDPGSGQLVLFDLGSTNGSFVNRAKVDTPRLLDTRATSFTSAAPRSVSAAPTPARDSILPAEERTVIAALGAPLSEQFVANERAVPRPARRRGPVGGGAARSSMPATAGSLPTSCSAAACTRSCRPRRCTCSAWRPGSAAHAELSLALRNHGVAAVARTCAARPCSSMPIRPRRSCRSSFPASPGCARASGHRAGDRDPRDRGGRDGAHARARRPPRRHRRALRLRRLRCRPGPAQRAERGAAAFVKFDMALVHGSGQRRRAQAAAHRRPGAAGDRPGLDRPGRRRSRTRPTPRSAGRWAFA